MDLATARHRIYRWAEFSPHLLDKMAADTVNTALEQACALEVRYQRLHDLFVEATGYEPSPAELGDDTEPADPAPAGRTHP